MVAWDRLILATGTRPMVLPDLEFDGVRIRASNGALSFTRVPASVLIVGGGVIGCGFAHILAPLGAVVTVIEALDRLIPLPSVDVDCSKVLLREMKKGRIKIVLNRTVTGVEKKDDGLDVVIRPSPFLVNPSNRDRAPVTPAVDTVRVRVGRQPNTDDIGLAHTTVEVSERGWVVTDDHPPIDNPTTETARIPANHLNAYRAQRKRK